MEGQETFYGLTSSEEFSAQEVIVAFGPEDSVSRADYHSMVMRYCHLTQTAILLHDDLMSGNLIIIGQP